MDIFDLIGPIMVGPSSSHTAGAVRIGLVARKMLGAKPERAEILLHGSFAATGRGHGTDRAIVAGLLGMAPDDERIPVSFGCAAEEGLAFEIGDTSLRAAHPNSVLIRASGGGRSLELIGASVGGGRIEIRELNGTPISFTAEHPTVIVKNEDKPGTVAEVSQILSGLGINIATFRVSRSSRGGEAVMVIECDEKVGSEAMARIGAIPGVIRAVYVDAI